jgi:predicted DNA-binding transcriptional regulator AlpA
MLMNIKEVAAYFDKCVMTIYRWIEEARAGNSTFPLPITPSGKTRMWRRSDIEGWDANGKIRPETHTELAIRNVVTASSLARHGLTMRTKTSK